MSWLDDILFAPIKWALPDELEKKLNPLFDVIGAVGNAALGKLDSAAADLVKAGKDTCELAGAKDAAKVLGKVAEGVELVGGGILKASDQALAAKAGAIKEGLSPVVSTQAADAAISKTLETVAVRAGTAVAAGTAGAIATGDSETFFDYAKMGDSLVKGETGLASGAEIAKRASMTAVGGAVGGALGKREGAEAGLKAGFGIGASLGEKDYAQVVAKTLGAGAGIAVGDKLAAKDDPKGPRKFNYRAFGAVNGLATGTVDIGQAVGGKDVRAALESTAGMVKNALKLKAESDRANGARPDKVLAKAIEAAGGVETAVEGIKTMNKTVARYDENRRYDALVKDHPLDLDDKERGA